MALSAVVVLEVDDITDNTPSWGCFVTPTFHGVRFSQNAEVGGLCAWNLEVVVSVSCQNFLGRGRHREAEKVSCKQGRKRMDRAP